MIDAESRVPRDADSLTVGAEGHQTSFVRAMLLLIQLIALALVVRTDFPPTGFPLDDAWIHQVVARTFAETGTLGYYPGQHGSGVTSTLWPLLLSTNFRWFHISPPLFSLILSGACFLAAGQLLLALLLADGIDDLTALALASLFHLSGNYVWFTASGMEVMLFVALSMFACWAWLTGARPRALLTGTALGLLVLVRPEAVFLAPVLPIVRRASVRGLAALAVPAVLMVCTYLALSKLHGTGFLPQTLAGRKWLWLDPFSGLSHLDLADYFLLVWATRLMIFTLVVGSPICFWLLVGLALAGIHAVVRHRPWPRGLLACILWTLAHTVAFVALMPAEGNGGRYQPLLPPMFLMCAGLGALTMWSSIASLFAPRSSRLLSAGRWAVLTAVAIPPFLGLGMWGQVHVDAIAHVRRTEIAMAQKIAELPPNSRVASFDIGAIGFFAGRRIGDLAALTDDSMVSALERGRAGDYLASAGYTHVVVPMTYPPFPPDFCNFLERLGLSHTPGLSMELLDAVMTPAGEYALAGQATMSCTPVQLLYRIHTQTESRR